MINKECSAMIKKLRESGDWCCVNISSDYAYVWDVMLYESYPNNDEHKITIKSGSHKNLNNAIRSAYKQARKHIAKRKK